MQEQFYTDILANRDKRAIHERWDALALRGGWLDAGCLFETVMHINNCTELSTI
jgi:hypothetical protein